MARNLPFADYKKIKHKIDYRIRKHKPIKESETINMSKQILRIEIELFVELSL